MTRQFVHGDPGTAFVACRDPDAGYAEHVAHVASQQAADPIDPSSGVPREFVARIVEVLHPLQIWLFGSRARGEARADSDWDMMAILPDDAPDDDLDLCSVWTRLRDLRLQRLELFTMTRSDFEEWNRSLGTLAEIVASTGIVVYDR
ncbi:MAG: nucleotidyltransferase domain-containing protein [Deltaproteobacteria bacterium]|nr:MAG: nucleotidyltransferase domain-containing protein [Deltaproteobacteria bacterium]